jgi:TolB-like protein
LKRPGSRAVSIAVLPFANLSADQNEYFSAGLAEEILNALTQVPGLRVVARLGLRSLPRACHRESELSSPVF